MKKRAKALRAFIRMLGDLKVLEPGQQKAADKTVRKIVTAIERRDFKAIEAGVAELSRVFRCDQKQK